MKKQSLSHKTWLVFPPIMWKRAVTASPPKLWSPKGAISQRLLCSGAGSQLEEHLAARGVLAGTKPDTDSSVPRGEADKQPENQNGEMSV